MARHSIHSMMSALPTLPALLEHIGHPPPRKGLSFFDFAIVLIAGCAHALSVAWPFSSGLTQGQPVWWLQLLALAALVWSLDRCAGFKQGLLLG